jgi:transposase
VIDAASNTPPPVIPEVTVLLAQLEEANKRARQAEISLQLSDLRVLSLLEQLRLLRIAKYGPRGESLSAAQLALFEEEPGATLDEVAAEAARGPLPEPARKKRKKHPGRQTLPANLPRVVNVVVCAPEQCACGNCGAKTEVIGYEESERLDVEPPKFFVAVTKREKRACAKCKLGGVVTAPAPVEIVEKGLATSRVVIDTVVAKYADHLPLYRQSAMLERDAGVNISRGTMDGWVMRVGELLGPITMAMRKEVLQTSYIQADETTVAVQRPEEKKGKNHQAYLWQFGSPGGSVVFSFDLGRGGEVARSFLGDYSGILQTDGYAAYDRAGGPGRIHAGCWAHARRYFLDAVKVSKADAVAIEFVKQINDLFAVDAEARDRNLPLEARNRLRQEKAAPLVEAIHAKLLEVKGTVLPKSKLGEALAYALGQWQQLKAFLQHSEIELSNNLAENSMRPIAVGRKNWIHIGSVEAGPKVAAILSVVETCKRLGIPVRKYLADVLPGMAGRKVAEAAELTPMAWKSRQPA